MSAVAAFETGHTALGYALVRLSFFGRSNFVTEVKPRLLPKLILPFRQAEIFDFSFENTTLFRQISRLFEHFTAFLSIILRYLTRITVSKIDFVFIFFVYLFCAEL